MNKISFLLLFASLQSFAQNQAVEMADNFRTDGKIYVVIAIISVVLIGIFAYLFSLDNKIKKLEK